MKSKSSESPQKDTQPIATILERESSLLKSDSPPNKVKDLSIKAVDSTELRLNWIANKESDFSHYNIYSNTRSLFNVTPGVTKPDAISHTNSYSDGGLSPGTTYYYKVVAVDKAGNIGAVSSTSHGKTKNINTIATEENSKPPSDSSARTGGIKSQEFTATTTWDYTPPAQVTGLIVSVLSSTQLKLTWNANREADINHYNIYRGTSSGFTVNPGVTQPVGISIANSFYNTGLNPSTKYYYKVAAVDNSGNIGARSSEKSATTSANQNPNLYDDFESGTYILSDGQKSPNGKWLNKYNGFGQVGVKEESNGNNILYGFPQTSKQKGETHASLLLSTQKVSNGIIEFDMRTDKQLRINDPPNTWEAAWVMWRYVDDFHHYYFVLKTNGIEFGKKDTSCHCEEQVFLKTGSSPKLQIGSWTHVKISSIGAHTSIWLNRVLVVDMNDPSYSRTADMSNGLIGLYNEDAAVSFDKISIDPQ